MRFAGLVILFTIQWLSSCDGRYVAHSTLPPPPSDDYFKEYNLDYERYLKEVVTALETDQAFVERLRNATPDDIQSGKIAEALDFVGHGVRNKLNQIKLVEIERLRRALENQVDHSKQLSQLEHLDHAKEAFDKNDLQKLIRKTAKDLDLIDAKRHQEYIEHEMEEELEFRRSLNNMTEEQQKEAKLKREEEIRKMKEVKMKHPGSKGQLQDVWEEVDNLPKEAFDMKTFFRLHDTNGDGYLDALELEALFQKELDKVWDPKSHAKEREEELIRMRRHVVEEMDRNGDGLVSFEEFMREENSPDFNEDSDWSPLDPAEAFSESELRSFEHEWEKEHPTQAPTQTPHGAGVGHAPDPANVVIDPAGGHYVPGQPVPQAPAAYPSPNVHPGQYNPPVVNGQPVDAQYVYHPPSQPIVQNIPVQPVAQQVPVAHYQQQQQVNYQQPVPQQQNIQYQNVAQQPQRVQYQPQQGAPVPVNNMAPPVVQQAPVPGQVPPAVNQGVPPPAQPQYQQQGNNVPPPPPIQVQQAPPVPGQQPYVGQVHNAPPLPTM